MAAQKKKSTSRPKKTKKTIDKAPRQFSRRPFKAVWEKVSLRPWWQRILLYILLFLITFFIVSWLVDKAWRPVKEPIYGTSFSIKYARELGSDWQANYLALLDDLHFKHMRVMSYWDLIEPKPGQYDFKDLDWQIDQAAAHGAKISLAIGLRQPRWPECHEPDWAKAIAVESPAWRNNLYAYMSVVVNRYKNNPSIESYQLENEAENAWFGDCRQSPAPKDRLNQEFKLVKKLDSSHPVLMSLGDEHGLPLGTPVPDGYGFSIYRVVYSTNTPIHFYVSYPITIWYHRLRAFIITHSQHRPVFIHELQLEPWGPKPTIELSVAEQNRSMSVRQMRESFDYGRRTGIKMQYMWGSEWWYWRKVHFQDPGPWDAVKQQLQASRSTD